MTLQRLGHSGLGTGLFAAAPLRSSPEHPDLQPIAYRPVSLSFSTKPQSTAARAMIFFTRRRPAFAMLVGRHSRKTPSDRYTLPGFPSYKTGAGLVRTCARLRRPRSR